MPKPIVPTVWMVMSTGWPAWCPEAKSTVGGLERRKAIAVKTDRPAASEISAATMAILRERDNYDTPILRRRRTTPGTATRFGP